jgi:hypothetical protein
VIETLEAGTTPFDAHPDPAVQLLLDRRAIEDLFYAYAAGVDRRDFDLVASCFAEDVGGPFGGTERRDRDALIEYISGVRFFHTTMHMMGNTLIEVTGDVAQLDTDAMIKHRGATQDGRDIEMNMSGSRYGEQLARRDGSWCITRRAVPPVSTRVGVESVASDDPAVRWLLDRAEIHDLLTRYAVGVDERNYAPVRACFARRLHANYLGHEFDDLDALTDFIRGVEHFGWTRHFFSRPLLSLRGNEASSDILAILSSRAVDDPKGRRERMSVGRYRDELSREDGRWRVTDRRHGVAAAAPQLIGELPASDDPATAYLLDRAQLEDSITQLAGDIDRETGTRHFVGNQLVELLADGARTETYVYRLEPEDEGKHYTPWHENAERWEDRLVRDESGWRVVEHRVCSNRIANDPPGADSSAKT